MCIRDRPKVARTLGHLLGRAQRYVNDVKSDISREIQLDELKKLQTEVTESARSVSYTHLRAHETVLDLVCRLLLEKKKPTQTHTRTTQTITKQAIIKHHNNTTATNYNELQEQNMTNTKTH